MSEVELKKLISHFALSNRSEGKSPKTEVWYTEMLSDFVRWLQSTGKSTTLAEFSVMNVREFVIHMQDRNLSPYTVLGHVGSLEAFDSWLFNEGYVPDNRDHSSYFEFLRHNILECDITDLCCISRTCESGRGTQSGITCSGLTDHKLGVRNVVTTLERGVNYGLSDRAG